MMKIKGFFLVILVFSFSIVYSQAIITFDRQQHDFGSIKEVEGTVSYNFTFKNTGNAPILIKNVESSCGCTSPEWTRQPVLPGKTGFVKATFDPKDRPGYFDKTITVFSNARNPVVELKIKGSVEAKNRTVLDDYPYELASGIRLPVDHISLMKVVKGETKTMAYTIYNNAGKHISVAFADLPAYLKVEIEPRQIEAGKTASLKASYLTGQQGEFGLNEEMISLVVDGKKYPLKVSIFIEEDFSGTDLQNAPVLETDKKYYSFGSVSSVSGTHYSYKITNTGKSPAKIYRVYANDKRVEVKVGKMTLASGESTEVTVKTVPGAAQGKLSCLISVISNCPREPELNLRFYGEIN